MSNIALFVAGTFVTLLVVAAMVAGALLDGRDERERQDALPLAGPGPVTADHQGDLWVVDAA
jgi:hypothetical protein